MATERGNNPFRSVQSNAMQYDPSRENSVASARLVRWTVSLHALAVLAQVGMAALVIAGLAGVFAGHRANAWVVLLFGALQALVAVSTSQRRFGKLYTLFAVAIPACEAVQIWLAGRGQTPWHVTLGLLIWAASLALLIRVWTPAWLAARPTP